MKFRPAAIVGRKLPQVVRNRDRVFVAGSCHAPAGKMVVYLSMRRRFPATTKQARYLRTRMGISRSEKEQIHLVAINQKDNMHAVQREWHSSLNAFRFKRLYVFWPKVRITKNGTMKFRYLQIVEGRGVGEFFPWVDFHQHSGAPSTRGRARARFGGDGRDSQKANTRIFVNRIRAVVTSWRRSGGLQIICPFSRGSTEPIRGRDRTWSATAGAEVRPNRGVRGRRRPPSAARRRRSGPRRRFAAPGSPPRNRGGRGGRRCTRRGARPPR